MTFLSWKLFEFSHRFWTVLFLFNGREKGAAAVAKLGKNSKFAEVDIDDMESLEKALHGAPSYKFKLFNNIMF